MKLSNISLVMVCTLANVVVLASGCGGNSNSTSSNPQSQGTQPLDQAMIASIQNPAGCLDLSLLMQKVIKAKKNRTTFVDAQFTSKPSDYWLATEADSWSDAQTNEITPNDIPTQDGCTSLTSKNSDGSAMKGKIVDSSQKMLKIQYDLSASVVGMTKLSPITRCVRP